MTNLANPGDHAFTANPAPSRTEAERETAIERADYEGFFSVQRVLEENPAMASRLTTALQYCQGGTEMTVHVDAGREPYLLLADGLNPGNYTPVAIYDNRIDYLDAPSNRCWLDLHCGEVLVDAGTAVYWR